MAMHEARLKRVLAAMEKENLEQILVTSALPFYTLRV